MDLRALLDELRTNRLDDAVVRYLWSDEELTSHLNDAVRQVCIRQRCMIESVDPAICQFTVGIGERLHKLHPSVLAVRSGVMTYADGRRRCGTRGHSMAAMDRWRHDWAYNNDYTDIDVWVPDFQEGYLALGGYPAEAGVFRMSVWRTPTEDELLDANDDTGEPVINANFHMDLVDWAEYRAFSKKDAETIDNGRAGNALASFEAKIGPLPTAQAIRLWAIQPIRSTGTRAEFI